MINDLTPVFQSQSSLAIKLNTQFYGVECKIYYPKNMGHYSGRFDDIEFSEDPDIEKRLLIPEIYEMKMTPRGGIHDNLNLDSFTLYIEHDVYIPENSKIVANSEKLGPIQFLVDELISQTTFDDDVYRRLTLTPFVSFEGNDVDVESTKEDLGIEFEEKLLDEEIEKDDSVANSVPDSERVKYKYRPME